MVTAERARVQAEIEALVRESHRNRLTVRAHIRQVWPGTEATRGTSAAWRLPALVLPGLAAVAGAVVAGRQVGIGTVFGGLTTAARWALPLYRAWRKAGRPS